MRSYDFLAERMEDGRQVKIPAVLDEFTRACLAIEAARSITSRDVMLTLQYLFAVRPRSVEGGLQPPPPAQCPGLADAGRLCGQYQSSRRPGRRRVPVGDAG